MAFRSVGEMRIWPRQVEYTHGEGEAGAVWLELTVFCGVV